MAKQKSDRERTVRVHITQDDFGYWMMSLERDDGVLTTATYAGQDSGHDIHHAYHPEEFGLPADAEFWISEPSVPLRLGDPSWTKPGPRRARTPYYVVKNGRRVN